MRRAAQLRFLAAAFAAGFALLAAACGGGDEEAEPAASAGGAPPASAALVGSDTPVFFALDTDFDSEQWQAAETLIERLSPGQSLDQALSSLGGEGIDFEQDVKPALGPEVGFAILELPLDGGTPPVVFFTKPADPAKLEALISKAEQPPVFQMLDDGWFALAESREHIDQALAAGQAAPLASDQGFAAALAEIPSEAVLRLYLSGAPLTEAFQQGFQQSGAGFTLDSLTGAGTLQSLALALSAEEGGFRLDGVATTEGGPEVTTYAPQLPAVAPAGALLYASFSDLRTGLSRFLDVVAEQTPDFAQQLGQVETALGVSVENDLLPLFEGELALYVREGLPIPEVTLLLSPSDPTKGLATLDKIALGASSLAGLAGETPPYTVTSTNIAGTPAQQVTIGETGFSLYYAQVGDNVVLTSAVSGVADLVAGSGSLAEDPRYVEATQAAGLPEQTSGFFYLDFERAAALIELATSTLESGSVTVPSEGLETLGALGYLVVHAGGSGSKTTFSGFLGVR